MPARVSVNAGSRLHAGFYYVGRSWSIRWGGLGFYSATPRIRVTASQCNGLRVEAGEWSGDVLRALELLGSRDVCLRVETDAKKHVGLGSTTQVLLSASLAVLAVRKKLQRLDLDLVTKIALKLGRGRVSWVGTLLFYYGGFVMDSGVPSLPGPRPVAALKVPEDWRFILVIPATGRGMSEAEEDRLLREPWEPDPNIQWLMSMGTLRLASGLARGDLEDALRGLDMVQRGTGSYFSKLQGGVYRSDLSAIVEKARGKGLVLAQSSWGPVLYTMAYRDEAGRVAELLSDIARSTGIGARVLVSEPRNEGAKIAQF